MNTRYFQSGIAAGLTQAYGCIMILATGAHSEEWIELHVRPLGTVIPARRGSVLLDVLLQAGVPISHSCRAGRCGTCRCELLSGEVVEDSNSEFRGRRDTLGRQLLACRTRLSGNCSIRLLETGEIVVHPPQVLKCRIEDLRALNELTLALHLRSSRVLSFSPGQYAQLHFGPGLTRPYSMANAPGTEILEFHLRRVPGGRVTSFVAECAQRGAPVKLTGPLGTAYLRRLHSGPVLCIAGGTGLAPIRSILHAWLSSTEQGSMHVYVGARSERELYGVEELRRLADGHARRLLLRLAVDEPPRDAEIRKGRITDVVAADLHSLAGWKVYLAGPPLMVDAGIELATRLGARHDDIHADAFYPTEPLG